MTGLGAPAPIAGYCIEDSRLSRDEDGHLVTTWVEADGREWAHHVTPDGLVACPFHDPRKPRRP